MVQTVPSTFLTAPLKFLYVAWVLGGGSRTKVFSRALRAPLLASVVAIPFLEASLEHFCRRPASLAGVAPSCVMPACASTLSSLWSIQLGCLVLPRILGRLRSSRRMLCLRCCLDEYFAADVAPLLRILCRVVSSRCFAAMLLVDLVWADTLPP